MSERFSNFTVGVFVLTALAILIGGSLWILGSTAIVGERERYTVVLEDSAGVEVGDRVRLAGVSVGRIQGIELQPGEPWPVRIAIDIRSDIGLREGTTATMATVGLMGATFLQLLPGPLGAPPLGGDAVIEGRTAADFNSAMAQVDALSGKLIEVLDQTSDVLAKISGEIDPMMARFDAVLSAENVEAIGGILAKAEATLGELEPRLGPLLAQMEAVSASAAEATDELPELTARLATLVDSMNAALGPDGERVVDLLAAAEGTLGSADDALGVLVDNRATIERMLVDLQDAMNNLERFSRQVRQRPSSLVRGGAPKDRAPGDGAEGGRR